MIRRDLARQVAEHLHVTQFQAKEAVDAFFESVIEALAQGERIELRGFGVFQVKARKTGIGRNPKTGEVVPIVPGRKVTFKPGLGMKKE